MPDNAIVVENARTDGVMPKSYWDAAHSRQIEGFATDMSVNAGDQVDFKINVNGDAGSDYQVEIFRLGYYGGNGARKVAEWVNTDAVVQPDAEYDATRALVDAGNWSVTDSWDTPADAVSGVYLARIQRLDASGNPIDGAANQIPFIVREDDRDADVVLQTSDTTWHAYNGWFGNNGQLGANFYGDFSGTVDHPDIPGAGAYAQDRAYAVSYNRPLITRGIEGDQGGPAAGAQDYLFGADYAAISWLEQNGFDVSYISGLDTDRLGADYLTKYNAFISVGHDEYWSGDQRANVEAARDAGVNLMFWGGNDIYWKTRWETSIVDGVEYRTLVCYKETWAVADPNAGPEDYYDLDPTDIWTGTWRDTRFHGNPDAGGGTMEDLLNGQCPTCNCAENSLTGQLFGPDGTGEFGGALDVPEEFTALRVWRDTSISGNETLDLAPGILGYEWNTTPDDENRPAGLIKFSETTIPWSAILTDQGNSTAPGEATHSLSMYRDESGALVFSAGTVFWTWGLSDEHDGEPYDAQIENVDLQQFMLNVFADMGIQPGVSDAVLASQNLVRASASADLVAATATIDDLPDTLASLQTVLITGTATDDDGNAATEDGVVALVEISFDGGDTWRPVSGTQNWSYSWTPTTEGSQDIMVRAIDDSLNLPGVASLNVETVEITPPELPASISLLEPFSEFDGFQTSDGEPLQLGTTFTVSQPGEVTALKYYRGATDADDTDVRSGYLWDASGTLLAEVEFSGGPGESGWQSAALSSPVQLVPGQQYVVSYQTDDNYVASDFFFGTPVAEPYGILSAPANSGVFATGTDPVFPVSTYNATNYWVDVDFSVRDVVNEAPVLTSAAGFSVDENALSVGTVTATDADGDAIRFTISGGDDAALFAIDAASGALSFQYAPDYEAPADTGGDNLYEVVVVATDAQGATAEQALTVAVGDLAAEEGTLLSTVFDPGETPAAIETADAADYELGMRFQAQTSGEIAGLRYFRGAADAADTDTRTLNLWSVDGTLLASATVASGPGQTGWQTAMLDTPVTAASGQSFVVSYGTTQNYAVSQNMFSAEQQSSDGVLVAPTGTNGLFNAGGPGLFPASTYQASNYWVDVAFKAGTGAGTGPNSAPSFSQVPMDFSVQENQTLAAVLGASDPDGDTLVFTIEGGADAGAFTLDAGSGSLSFAQAPDFEAPGDSDGDNVYELLVSVSDGINPAVQETVTVAVTDDAAEPGSGASTLFAPGDAPEQIVTSDPSAYELGVKFTTDTDGTVSSLRYYRGAADAGDTDIRNLNLWAADGTLLASVAVQSDPGEIGWQSGVLATPVALDAGAFYVASYGTTQNYAFTDSFFANDWGSADGHLTAPANAGGNGLFSVGGTGLFPTNTYQASNYWVDVTFQAGTGTGTGPNSAPSFSQVPMDFSVQENQTLAAVLGASDPDGDTLVFTIEGGADAGAFTLDAGSGSLSFAQAPDFEAPGDSDGDNVYELLVSVSDGINPAVQETVTVAVTDDATEPGPDSSTLFAPGDLPDLTVTSDPTDYELGVRFTVGADGMATGLRYYRGTADADDLDVRILNLWSSDGALLASVTVVSDQGVTGWQGGTFETPVRLDAGTSYVASYGTTQNYAYSSSFFADDWVSDDGYLTAPADGGGISNGVFFAGGTNQFPTQSYNASNYWVDPIIEPLDLFPLAGALPPVEEMLL